MELPPGEVFPVAPLQRLARWGLAVALLLVGLAVGVVALYGPAVFYDDDRVRITVTGLMLGALAVFAFVSARAGLWMRRSDAHLDERDQVILGAASSGQSGAMLVTLAVWIIALIEHYRVAGSVPLVFLYLIFWSTLMASLLAWLAGVVLGYRRS